MKKLNDKQQKVIDLLKDGWELGVSSGWGPNASPSIRLQKGGLGKGGETYYFKSQTLYALERMGLIKKVMNNRFEQTTRYCLTLVDKLPPPLDN